MRREDRLQAAQRLDRISTLLVHAGVQTIRRYPVPSLLYVAGLLLCLFFAGFKVSEQQYLEYDAALATFDQRRLEDTAGTVFPSCRIDERPLISIFR